MAEVTCPSCGARVSTPETRTGLWWGIGCLVAALAVPFLVSVIGVLAAIAIPSFVKARDTARLHACVSNLRMLSSAKASAALEHSYSNGHTVSEQDVAPYVRSDLSGLVCPVGGEYLINPVGKEPECSVHGSPLDAPE